MENLQTDLSVKAEINLYYDLFIPENFAVNAPLMIAVHGYGAHKRHMMREARAVAPADFVIASVQGPHQHFRRTDTGLRTGFGWLTDHKPEESIALHHNFLRDVIEKLAGDGIVDRSRIFLYGFSQSCALNFRFAFTYPEIPRGVVGISGGIPGDLDTNPKYQPFEADTFYIYGDEDEFYPLDKFESFEKKLREKLPNFRSKKYSAEHAITEEMREDIRNYLFNAHRPGEKG
jgi:predicted esterase